MVALLCSALLLAIAPAAGAASARIADTSAGDPQYGPTLGDGYVYWISSRPDHGLESLTLFQRRISDGTVRVLLRSNRSIATGLYARGDKVAFSLTRVTKRPAKKRPVILSERVYAMSAEDPAPAVIVKSSVQADLSLDSGCGKSNSLFDISPAGEVLVELYEDPCSGGPTRTATYLYPYSGGAPVKAMSLFDADFASLQFGKIVATTRSAVQVRDPLTGAVAVHHHTLEPYWVMLDGAGNLVTLTEGGYNARSDKALNVMKIFQAGASKPTSVVKEWLIADPIVLLCAGGIVEFYQPLRGPSQIMLRAFDGSVVSKRDGPRTGFDFDAGCQGSHVTLAARWGHGSPAIFGYDF